MTNKTSSLSFFDIVFAIKTKPQNHMSVGPQSDSYFMQGELFLLLTDQGFLTEDKIVWQTLSNVDGSGVFVDCNFKSLSMKNEPVQSNWSTGNNALSQEDQE